MTHTTGTVLCLQLFFRVSSLVVIAKESAKVLSSQIATFTSEKYMYVPA